MAVLAGDYRLHNWILLVCLHTVTDILKQTNKKSRYMYSPGRLGRLLGMHIFPAQVEAVVLWIHRADRQTDPQWEHSDVEGS